jgi:hypothetical protein
MRRRKAGTLRESSPHPITSAKKLQRTGCRAVGCSAIGGQWEQNKSETRRENAHSKDLK